MFRLFAIAAIALALTGCDDRWHDYSYKMTVYADGKAYSTVRHVKVEEGATIQDSTGRRVDRSVEGQAIIIETPSGPVFALMKPEEGDFGFGYYAARVAEPALEPAVAAAQESDADRAMRKDGERKPGFDHLADDAARHNAMLEVKGEQDLPRTIPNPDPYRKAPVHVWPLLVRFDALDMPASVRKVSPESIGVTRITIEITDENVTDAIGQRISWLDDYYDKMLDGNRLRTIKASDQFANKLSQSDFSQGFKP